MARLMGNDSEGEQPGMSGTPEKNVAGEELVKQNLITRGSLEKAQQQEQSSGTPWV